MIVVGLAGVVVVLMIVLAEIVWKINRRLNSSKTKKVEVNKFDCNGQGQNKKKK